MAGAQKNRLTDLEAAVRGKFKGLSQYPLAILDSRNTGQADGRKIEFYPPREGRNPYPGMATVELFDPTFQGEDLENAVAADFLHFMGKENPVVRRLRGAFLSSMTPEQKGMDRRAYMRARAGDFGTPETRPYDQWMDTHRLDQYLISRFLPRGSRDRAEWEQGFTPRQRQLLDQVEQYVRTGQAWPSAGAQASGYAKGGVVQSPGRKPAFASPDGSAQDDLAALRAAKATGDQDSYRRVQEAVLRKYGGVDGLVEALGLPGKAPGAGNLRPQDMVPPPTSSRPGAEGVVQVAGSPREPLGLPTRKPPAPATSPSFSLASQAAAAETNQQAARSPSTTVAPPPKVLPGGGPGITLPLPPEVLPGGGPGITTKLPPEALPGGGPGVTVQLPRETLPGGGPGVTVSLPPEQRTQVQPVAEEASAEGRPAWLPPGFSLTPPARQESRPAWLPQGFSLTPPKPVPPAPEGTTTPQEAGELYGPGFARKREQYLRFQAGERPSAFPIRDEKEALQAAGLSTDEGAPAKARMAASFGLDTEKTMADALTYAFNGAGLPTGNMDVRKEVIGGKEYVTFTDPRDGVRRVWNVPGVSLSDFASVAGEIPVLLGEAGLGSVGAAVGVPAGPAAAYTATAGAAIGAFLGEIMRLQIGRNMGLNQDMTVMDQVSAAGLESIYSLAGAGVAAAALKLAKKTFANMPGALDGISAKELDEAIARYEAEAAEVEAKTGRDFPATTGQVLERPDIVETELRAAAQKTGGPLRDVYERQQDVISDLANKVLPPPKAPIQKEEIGKAIQREMVREPVGEMEDVARATEAARGEVSAAQAMLQDRATAATEAAADARQLMETGVTKLDERFSADYDALARDVPEGTIADLSPVVRYLRGQGRERQEALFRNLEPDLQTYLREAMRPELTGLRFTRQGAVEGQFIPYAQLWRDLKRVKEQVRLLGDRAKAPGGLTLQEAQDREALKGLRDAMEGTRSQALKDLPELEARNQAIKEAYTTYSDQVKKAIRDEYLVEGKSGGYALDAKALVNRVLSSKAKVEAIQRAATSYEAELAPVVDALKRGARGKYLEAVADPKTGLLDHARHDAFFRDERYGPGMRTLFGDDVAEFGNARRLAEQWKRQEALEKASVQRINRAFGMKLQEFEPGKIVAALWDPDNLDSLRKLRATLPEGQWKDFQDAVKAEFFKKSSSFSDANLAYEISLPALMKNIDEYALALTEVFGDQYVKDLRQLEQAFRLVSPRGAPYPTRFMVEAGATTEQRASPARWVMRIMTGQFTTAGRAFTAGLRTEEVLASRLLAASLADPYRLHNLVSRREKIDGLNTNAGLRVIASIVGQQTLDDWLGNDFLQ